MPSADGIAGHHGYHGFWQTSDLHLEIKHVQVLDTLSILVPAVIAAHALIPSRAKGFFTPRP